MANDTNLQEVATRLIANRRTCRVTSRRPCEICGSDGWCIADEYATLCPRSNGEGAACPKKFGTYGWLHLKHGQIQPTQPRQFQKPKKRLTDAEMHVQMAPHARHFYRGREAEVAMLAEQLGVATWTFDALKVGYGTLYGKRCWTFPERNPTGLIVGINARFVESVGGKSKLQLSGSRRGLTYVDNWADYSGPVLVVEGGSDTAAGLTLQRAVVGRPSCTGGIEYLVRLLGKLPPNRRIIVVAERDRKKHDDLPPKVQARHWQRCPGCMQCWPGRSGATETAKRLTKRLGRRVIWLLPSGAKDLRDWLNQQGQDVEDTDAMAKLGKKVFA